MIERHEQIRRASTVWRRSCLLAAVWALSHGAESRAETVTLTAALDATLIEDPGGELANGSGPALFVGRTSQSTDSRRRALVFFDVAGALPRGASIERAELRLVLTPSHDPVAHVSVHRVLSPWSEGPSAASGGAGAQAVAGDATWLHRHYDTGFWTTPGGDFAGDPSGFAAVGSPGPYVWGSTAALEADVQAWLDEPACNHGWLLIGDEELPSTTKRFASREDPLEDMHPQLSVVYRVGCEAADLAPGAFGLCKAYCEALDCDEGPSPPGHACATLAGRFEAQTDGLRLPCEISDPEFGEVAGDR